MNTPHLTRAYALGEHAAITSQPGFIRIFTLDNGYVYIHGEANLRTAREAIDHALCERVSPLPAGLPGDLAGRIVDEAFDGAIEDVSVIEDIYRVIAAYFNSKAKEPQT